MLNSIVKERSARRLTSGPHTGVQPGTKASAITCTACQSRLSSTLKADCPAVQLTNLGYAAADVKREDFENFETLLTTHRQTDHEPPAGVKARLGDAVFPLPPPPEVAL